MVIANNCNDYQFAGEQLTAEAGTPLQEVAQGINTPSVESGLHARQIIEQSIVALSDLRMNTTRALERGYRIYMQLIRAYFTTPQQLRWMGEDGQMKLKRWPGISCNSAANSITGSEI